MASFLVRAYDLPATATDFFVDDEGSMHEDDINRLTASGITGGCGTDTYCPTSGVSRAQMASFLARAMELASAPTDYFGDDDGSVHEPDINRLAGAAVTR